MDRINLIAEGTDKVVAWACGKCRLVRGNSSDADQCCLPWKCLSCGNTTRRQYWTSCDSCVSAKAKRNEVERYAKAEKVLDSEWNGPVYVEQWGDYFASIPEMHDSEKWAGPGNIERPLRVYTCAVVKFEIDIDGALDTARNNWLAEEGPDPVDWAELVDYIAQWNAKQDAECWEPDFKRAIAISTAEQP